ncbi:MAG: hypothetical protein WKG07_18780 [Hymenobacter sp.]
MPAPLRRAAGPPGPRPVALPCPRAAAVAGPPRQRAVPLRPGPRVAGAHAAEELVQATLLRALQAR